MARIAGVDIPRDKRTVIALTYVYGVGDSTSRDIIDATGVDGNGFDNSATNRFCIA